MSHFTVYYTQKWATKNRTLFRSGQEWVFAWKGLPASLGKQLQYTIAPSRPKGNTWGWSQGSAETPICPPSSRRVNGTIKGRMDLVFEASQQKTTSGHIRVLWSLGSPWGPRAVGNSQGTLWQGLAAWASEYPVATFLRTPLRSQIPSSTSLSKQMMSP